MNCQIAKRGLCDGLPYRHRYQDYPGAVATGAPKIVARAFLTVASHFPCPDIGQSALLPDCPVRYAGKGKIGVALFAEGDRRQILLTVFTGQVEKL